ncbi:MAG: hypothetical protein HOH77_17930 [Candidatus Latescibacteria bacterium]|nr:hypothetical protein [Candidatus Latescibacterota bacterium]
MAGQPKRLQDRRAFVVDFTRYLTLGALATLSGILYARYKSASPDDCTNLEICNGCSAYRGCDLPPALLAKTATDEVSRVK